jgi:hypothetical protein
MGKMKELFMQQMEEQRLNMSDAEYQDWLHSQEITGIPNGDTMSDTDDDCCGGDCHCEGESATQEDKISEHDAWWNSLTDEQKQQLCEEQKAMEKERIELSIEEMNHDLSFGK